MWRKKYKTKHKSNHVITQRLEIEDFYCCSVTQSCPTLCNPMDYSTVGFHVLHYLPKFAQTHVHWVGNAIQPSHPLSPPSPDLQSFPASGSFPMSWVFSNELALHIRWPEYWRFSFSISPSNGYSGLISFRMDWLDLLAVQGTLRVFSSSSKASILWRSAFFIVQLSHPYTTTRKTSFECMDICQQSDVSAF